MQVTTKRSMEIETNLSVRNRLDIIGFVLFKNSNEGILLDVRRYSDSDIQYRE